MSFQSLSPAIKEIAERELTRKQLDVFKLWCAHASFVQMSNMLDITEATARGHHRRALQIIGIHMRAAGLTPDPIFDATEPSRS